MIHAFLITGFLGVGKSSTLTNTIKNHFQDKQIALIVNEFGDVGVDQNILKNVHSDVIEISEGCICCQVAEELENGLLEIIEKYNPDMLFIEASGAAEPFPVFMSMQNIGLSVDGVICVVDAKNYPTYIDNPTAKYQIGGSNIIILNKADLLTEEELEVAKEEIIEFKEKYDLKNTLTGQKVFNNYFIHTATNGVLGKEVFEGTYQIDEIIGLAEDYHKHDHSDHDLIDKRVVKIKGEIEFDAIDALIKALPKNIYRVKGMIKTTDVPTPLIINYSFGNVAFEELKDYTGESILVFIGEEMDKDMDTLTNEFKYLELVHHEHNH